MNKCRACGAELATEIINLKKSPPSNAYLPYKKRYSPEVAYPLIVMLCECCYLVQTVDFTSAENLFDNNYAYLSSTSTTWLLHSQKFVDQVVEAEDLNEQSFVVELASNDGYLLNFFENKNIPNLGIEPTASTAIIAMEKGIDVIQDFFSFSLSEQISRSYGHADLIIANNVYAHVPDIVDFTKGICKLLATEGVVSIEFPHLLNLIKYNQFDTIYHEHFSYLSLTAVQYIFKKCDLKIINVEEIDTHGGSLRVWGAKYKSARPVSETVIDMLEVELIAGLKEKSFYSDFKLAVDKIKIDFLAFLIDAKKKGEVTVGYGAAAKGNTLLNFCGIDDDLITLIFDNSLEKQGKISPGSNIPIQPLSDCNQYRIDNVIIFPWNIKEELKASFSSVYSNPVKYYIAVPELKMI
jgi:hypothetical protein